MTVRSFLERHLPKWVSWLLLAFLFVPVLVVIPVALTDKSYLSMPQDGISFEHFAALLEWRKGWLSSILTSMYIGVLAGFITTAIAAAFSIGAWVHAGRWPAMLRVLLLSPMILPPMVYAVAMVRLFSSMRILDTVVGVTIVHVVLAMPLAVLAIGASLSNLDPRLVQAARALGARPPTIFGKVILPNIAPGLIAGFVLSFIVSWDEITVTLFITSRQVVTLPRRIWTSIADSVDPALAAIATVMLVATVIGLLLRMLVWDRRQKPSKTA